LAKRRLGDVKQLIDPLLLAAELIESNQADRGEYFLTDAQVRHHVFMGTKWFSGRALVLGGQPHPKLVEELQRKEFQFFTDQPGLAGVSLPFIRSKKFWRGDGGLTNVAWGDGEFYSKLAESFLTGQPVTTENGVANMA